MKFNVLFLILLFMQFYIGAVGYIPYQGVFKQVETEHSTIIYPDKYENIAKITSVYIEDIVDHLIPFYNWTPNEKVTIIISGHTDDPNGLASPFGRNCIVIYTADLDHIEDFRETEDALYGLILHEMAHIYQLDQIRGGAWFWRVLFGKLYFPLAHSFLWFKEGSAILAESRFASNGRLDNMYHISMMRTIVKDGKIPMYHELVSPVNEWPYGGLYYHVGADFIGYIYDKYGEEKWLEFHNDLSDDFWPFIFQFVMKFKKVYDVKLNDLWKEWRDQAVEKYSSNITMHPGSEIGFGEGDFYAFTQNKRYIFYSQYSKERDRGFYLYDKKSGKETLLGRQIIYDAEFIDDENLLLIRSFRYPDGYNYKEVFHYNIKTRFMKKLTTGIRASYLVYNDGGGYIISNDNDAVIMTYKFDGKTFDIKKQLAMDEEFRYIGKPSDKEKKLLFSGRTDRYNRGIYVYEIDTENITKLPIEGHSPKWVNGKIMYIEQDADLQSVKTYDYTKNLQGKLFDSSFYIKNFIINDKNFYYIAVDNGSEKLFKYKFDKNFVDYIEKPEDTDNDLSDADDIYQETFKNENTKYSLINNPVKNIPFEPSLYNPLKFMAPTYWGPLPYNLNSDLMIGNSRFALPSLGVFMRNEIPLGWFYYNIFIGFDYMKLYPDNMGTLTFKIPFFNITYNWDNRTDPIRLKDRYALSLNHGLSITSDISFGFYGTLTLSSTVRHYFHEYLHSTDGASNHFEIYNSIIYTINRSSAGASRWNRGVQFSLTSVNSPEGAAQNNGLFLLKGSFKGRYPVGNAFFFTNLSGGHEFNGKNLFQISTPSIRLFDLFALGSEESINIIDMKAFGMFYEYSSFGESFIDLDMGFDISLYKKSIYWNFMTMGFKELYLKVYGEFSWIYHTFYSDMHLIHIDGVIALCADFFVGYGMFPVTLVSGFAGGYRIGDDVPALNLMLYLDIDFF